MNPFSNSRRRSRSRGGQPRLVLVLGVAAVIGAIFLGPVLASSQAFSALDGDRGADVAVADDPEAYLGLDATESVVAGQRTELATLTNHLGTAATVALTLVSGAGDIYASGDVAPGTDQVEVALDPGETVTVDLNASSAGTIDYRVVGTTTATTVRLERSVAIDPSPVTPGDCTFSDDALVLEHGHSSDVQTTEDVIVEGHVTADVETTGDVKTTSGSRVDGDVEAGGCVILESGSQINGGIEAGGDVTVGSGARANGDVAAGGDVTVESGGRVDGDVDAGGDITVESGARIDGDASAGGTVTVENGGRVNGDVEEGSG
jgi:cytoskeletal protein CcmA (bactofilin family)